MKFLSHFVLGFMSNLIVFFFFQDSVTAVEFSQDGNYVATADMAGQIQVWRTSSMQKIWEYAMGDMTVSYTAYFSVPI